MIKITCDTCGTVKSAGQPEWIIGYDLQFDTPRAVGRSLSFYEHWDNSRILERGAVHFCSPECKEAYVASNTLATKAPKKKISARGRNRKIA
jgi:hypothetical protein